VMGECVIYDLEDTVESSTFMILFKVLVVYYESMKRELQTRPIHECRYDERLKTRDEVNRRDVSECDG
jgi:hypothetical protein